MIAQTSGVLMIATAAGTGTPSWQTNVSDIGLTCLSGAIGDAFDIIDQGAGRGIQWAGDHIFELNLLKMALEQWNDAALTTLMFTASSLHTPYHPSPKSNRSAQCQHVIDRFTGILNAPANLIGVDAVINMLKKDLLQVSNSPPLVRTGHGR